MRAFACGSADDRDAVDDGGAHVDVFCPLPSRFTFDFRFYAFVGAEMQGKLVVVRSFSRGERLVFGFHFPACGQVVRAERGFDVLSVGYEFDYFFDEELEASGDVWFGEGGSASCHGVDEFVEFDGVRAAASRDVGRVARFEVVAHCKYLDHTSSFAGQVGRPSPSFFPSPTGGVLISYQGFFARSLPISFNLPRKYGRKLAFFGLITL